MRLKQAVHHNIFNVDIQTGQSRESLKGYYPKYDVFHAELVYLF